jgi:hypothetical protein
MLQGPSPLDFCRDPPVALDYVWAADMVWHTHQIRRCVLSLLSHIERIRNGLQLQCSDRSQICRRSRAQQADAWLQRAQEQSAQGRILRHCVGDPAGTSCITT